MTDLTQLERSSLTTLRIIVDLMAEEIVALRAEVKRLKAEGTQNPQTTPGECSKQGDGTSGPVAWWLKGSEYDTGCEYEYVSLLKENAEAAAKEGGTVVPLYRSPTLTDAECEAVEFAANRLMSAYVEERQIALTLRRLLSRSTTSTKEGTEP